MAGSRRKEKGGPTNGESVGTNWLSEINYKVFIHSRNKVKEEPRQSIIINIKTYLENTHQTKEIAASLGQYFFNTKRYGIFAYCMPSFL